MAEQNSNKKKTTKKTDSKTNANKKTTVKTTSAKKKSTSVKNSTPKTKNTSKKTTTKKPTVKKTTTKNATVSKTKQATNKKNTQTKKPVIKPVEKKEEKVVVNNNNNNNKKAKQQLIRLGIRLVEGLTLIAIFIVVLTLALKKPKVNLNIHLDKNSYKVVDRTNKIKKYKKENDYTIVGWIKVQGTNIDYPVLFYDTAPISDVRQNIGWIYNTPKKLQDRTVIEGHNILNMSSNPRIADKDSRRFEQLMSFTDESFVRNNKYIQYSMGTKNYVFKIYAVGFPEHQVYYTKPEMEKEEKKAYIEDALKNSLYKFDIDVNEDDKLISLYTCTRFYGYSRSVAFRVDGRLVRKNERIKNYDMETTKEFDNAKSYANSIKKSQEVSS